jgi:hypothetical protein
VMAGELQVMPWNMLKIKKKRRVETTLVMFTSVKIIGGLSQPEWFWFIVLPCYRSFLYKQPPLWCGSAYAVAPWI